MKIWMIWVRSEGATWLVTAWDDESRGEAFDQWAEELGQAVMDYGVDNVRVLSTTVAMGIVDAAFQPTELVNSGTAKENI